MCELKSNFFKQNLKRKKNRKKLKAYHNTDNVSGHYIRNSSFEFFNLILN